ncbi:MAG: hypothetical protein WC415_06730 [Patescibacteria group bacterium]|jgi:DNA polymerase-3 subunit delta'
MEFKWKTIGNQKAVEYLDKSLSNNQIANFYIFSGLTGLGKFSLAKNFITNIFIKDLPGLTINENFLETNSDFWVIEREVDKKNISIDQIREFIAHFHSSSFMNSYRAAIIKEAECLNDNSANALLKVLEEVNNKTIIILTVNDVESLPKTITSRGQVINLFPVKDDLIYQNLVDNFSLSPNLARSLARLSDGRPGMALQFLENENLYQNYQSVVNSFLDFLPAIFSERLKIIDEIIKKNDILDNFSILQIWQSVIRDLIFLNYNQCDYIKNDFALDKLKIFKTEELTPEILSQKSLIITTAEDYLKSNINLRSVLEYIAVNI